MKFSLKDKIVEVIKKDTVLVIAAILAVISMFFNPPSKKYIDFIDFRVLGILLSLMIVMSGLSINGIFKKLGKSLIGKCNSTRTLAFVLIFLCFFSSMLLTNDVALITFVPLALLTLKMSGNEKLIIIVVVMQTIAANLGSMLTPMGNPQNLYLYGISGMGIGKFLLLMLPYTVVSAVLLCIVIFTVKKEELTLDIEAEYTRNEKNIDEKNHRNVALKFSSEEGTNKYARNKNIRITIYFVMFILCILVVVRVLPWHIIAGLIFIVALLMEKEAVKGADYALLLTFIAFFIFIGNMGEIPAIKNMLSSLVKGREVAVSIISSQAVSNVPAALLLSGFTTDYEGLIIGTNLGGLGTLIASMASLISYKQVANGYPNIKGKYFVSFTVWNVVFLAVLAMVACVI